MQKRVVTKGVKLTFCKSLFYLTRETVNNNLGKKATNKQKKIIELVHNSE